MNSIVRGAAGACLFVLLLVPAHAQVVRQLTDGGLSMYHAHAIDDAGDVVFTISWADPNGTNPDHSPQVFRWNYPGPVGTQVGSIDGGVAGDAVSVTDDGGQVVFIAPADPLGVNHDRSLELFLMAADGTGIVQLTDDPSPTAGSVLDAKIAGSGNRVAFLADTDPLGTNPDHLVQLFVVETSTLAVTQVTTATTGEFQGFSISDDGDRVVFSHDGDPIPNAVTNGQKKLFTFQISISLLKQATFESSSSSPALSGNGEKIAFRGPGGIVVRGWFDSTQVVIASGLEPSISDDGEWVYYSGEDNGGNYEIWAAHTSGSGLPAQLTVTLAPFDNDEPVVSGDNTRVVFESYGGEFPGGSNPDLGRELIAMDADGSNVDQLTDNSPAESSSSGGPVFTADGSRIVFSSRDVYRMQTDGSDLFRITTDAGAYGVSASADGGTIVFESRGDPTGQNPDHLQQVFKVQSDGTGLVQLGPSDCESRWPSISADASVVTIASTCDWTGGNSSNNREVFALFLDGGANVQITDDAEAAWEITRVSANGVWVTYMSRVSGLNQVYRARVDGTGIEQITSDAEYDSLTPDISADGTRIAYSSTADPAETNADHNYEIFLFDAETTTTRQLTFTSSGASGGPRISGDVSHVYFMSDAPFFESVPGGHVDVYRVKVETGVVERVGGFRDRRSSLHLWSDLGAVAHGGDLAAYQGFTNPTGENPDLGSEIWLVDFTTPATIRPGRATPTVVTWDVEPSPVRYDVIRGNVADLQTGPADTVDLGPVVCLEDDSPDATTLGFEDPDQPLPGQAFFFVYRGSQGIDDGPGTWGQGSGDAERVAGAGSCTP